MRRLFMLFAIAAVAAVVWAPSAATAHASLSTPRLEVTTPAPSAPSDTSPSSVPPATAPLDGRSQTVPSSDGTTATDALTVVGFAIVAMTGLVLVLRAGLRSSSAEDDD